MEQPPGGRFRILAALRATRGDVTKLAAFAARTAGASCGLGVKLLRRPRSWNGSAIDICASALYVTGRVFAYTNPASPSTRVVATISTRLRLTTLT
jgi:hypothetical protein